MKKTKRNSTKQKFKSKTLTTKQNYIIKGGGAGGARDASDGDPEID